MKVLLIALLLFAIPALAVHTSDILIAPQLSGASAETDFSVNVTNKGKDSINEVRVRIPVEFSSLKCGEAPKGWSLAYSDAVECNYKTVASYITTDKSLLFALTVTTSAKDGNYTWEIRSRDVFDGFSLHNPITATDSKAPSIKDDTLKVPNGGEKWETSSVHDILWSSRDIADNNLLDNSITLEYTTDGKSWKTIATNEENDGAYTWMVPAVADNVRIRLVVEDKAGNTASDESDAPFAIVAAAPTVSIKVGESKTLDVNKDGKNDTTITVKSASKDEAELIIEGVPEAAPLPVANVTATPAPAPEKGVLTNPTVTAIVVILILIILYLIWRLQHLEKKKK